jgi:hypothetical protein
MSVLHILSKMEKSPGFVKHISVLNDLYHHHQTLRSHVSVLRMTILKFTICRGRHVHDLMIVGFTSYHHWSCTFEPRSWRGVLDRTLCDKVCQWLAKSLCFPPVRLFPPAIKLNNWNIVESGTKHHKPPNQPSMDFDFCKLLNVVFRGCFQERCWHWHIPVTE